MRERKTMRRDTYLRFDCFAYSLDLNLFVIHLLLFSPSIEFLSEEWFASEKNLSADSNSSSLDIHIYIWSNQIIEFSLTFLSLSFFSLSLSFLARRKSFAQCAQSYGQVILLKNKANKNGKRKAISSLYLNSPIYTDHRLHMNLISVRRFLQHG